MYQRYYNILFEQQFRMDRHFRTDGRLQMMRAQLFRELISGDSSYPVGLTESFAYQNFSVDRKDTQNLVLKVDAFAGMLKCKESDYIRLAPGTRIPPSLSYTQTVKTENCTYPLNLTFPEHSYSKQYYGRVLLSICNENAVMKGDTLPLHPTTIMDMAILTRESQPFMQMLRGLGASGEKEMRSRIGSHNFKLEAGGIPGDDSMNRIQHPLVLHPVTRLVFTLLIVAIIITLELMPRRSEHNRGLMNFQVCLLAPYQNLSSGAPSRVTLLLDLRDKLSVTAFVTAIRVRQFAVAVAILAAFATSFLTIAAASLFSVQQVTADNVPIQLIPQDTLDFAGSWNARSYKLSSLLSANLNYPPFTFQDLVYPSLRWNESTDYDFSNRSHENDVFIETNIPAIRSAMSCTIYTRPHVEATLRAFEVGSHYIHIKLPGQNCTSWDGSLVMNIEKSLITRDFYFGIALPGSQRRSYSSPTSIDLTSPTWPVDPDNIFGCTSHLYAWGRISNWSNSDVSSVVAMGCDEQMQEVNTELTLFGSDLEVRPDHPPQPDISSAHAVMHAPKGCLSDLDPPCEDLKHLYEDSTYIITSEALDPFFSALTLPSSILALDLSALGNEPMAQTVGDAVIFQHGILRGQAFSASSRTPLNNPNAGPTVVSSLGSDGLSFPANVTITSTTTGRIIQDSLSTRILEALLGTVLALSCLSWIASPNTKILPRSPVSIASVAAWLADGDIFDLLPDNAQEMTKSELKLLFDDEHFYMRVDGLESVLHWLLSRKREHL
ncbi:hypothetical protein GGR58DRAFT_503046 [Xylaria digitata]|nr:hypothetical protein GGR58DRAFT_503046 [Xylaria digitata]